MKKMYFAPAALLLLFAASGCMATPETSSVTSKADGSLEAGIYETAEDGGEENLTSFSAQFTNTSGSITYQVDLSSLPDTSQSFPVLQVTPHTITSAEAEQVAKALYGDAQVYEYSETLSKGDIEEKILAFRQLLGDRDTLAAKFGEDEDSISWATEYYERLIESYEAAYETASDTVEKTLCDWQFYPDTYYTGDAGMDTDSEEFQNYNKTVYVRATAQVEENEYQYWVCNRSESDYQLHYFNSFLNLPGAEAALYSAEVPTQEDISQAEADAQALLDGMDQGEWGIRSSQVVEYQNSNGQTVYAIQLAATKTYQGVGVTYASETVNLSGEDVYASVYGLEEATFTYSGGQLIVFYYNNPLEVVAQLNDNVSILSFQQAAEALETWAGNTEITSGMGLTSMEVNVNRVELGLYKVRMKNNDTDYYLLPAYTFFGTTSEDPEASDQAIAVINAVDGTVVDTKSGY